MLCSLLCPLISMDSVKMPKEGSLRDKLQLGAQHSALGLQTQFTIYLTGSTTALEESAVQF